MELALSFIFSFLIVFFPFVKTYNIGINMADEGYLWYGIQQTLKGNIPVRDFRAYDPGRYYWGALWCKIFGDNLIAVRLGLKIFQFICFSLAFYYFSPFLGSSLITMFFLVFLFLWSGVIHKTIDNSMPILSVIFILQFLHHPNNESILALGLFSGFSLLVGLNHFVYNSFALLFTVPVLYSTLDLNLLTPLALGLIIGLAPFIIYLALPGCANSYFNKKIFRLLKRKTTNLKLPVPLPWNEYPLAKHTTGFSHSLKWCFACIPLLYLFMFIIYVFSDQKSTLMLSAILVGIPYTNHIYSRADKNHLIGGIAPLILLFFTLFQENIYAFTALIILLLIATYYIIWQKDYALLFNGEINKSHTKIDLKNNFFQVPNNMALLIKETVGFLKTHHLKNKAIYLPNLAGFYAITHATSLTYDTFPVYPSTEVEEAQMLNDFKNNQIAFCLIDNKPLDGKESLRFEKTYPKVWNYIHSNFDKINYPGLKNGFSAFLLRP